MCFRYVCVYVMSRQAAYCVIGVLFTLSHTLADIDLTVCDPRGTTAVPPPPPNFPPGYTSRIEWKWVDTNSTVDIVESYNSIIKKGSQIMYIEGQKVHILYDYTESQYVTYSAEYGCKVKGLASVEMYQNKPWFSAVNVLYGMARRANPSFNGTETIRSTYTSKWVTCLDLFQFNITMELEMYFSAIGWAMPLSAPSKSIPVRFVLRGSMDNADGSGKQYFTAIGDFIEFNPQLPDPNLMQLPAGTYCPGRLSSEPLHVLPETFSLVTEIIETKRDKTTVTYESVWFDSTKRLVRRDYKRADDNDPDPYTEIFDFNLGIHYKIDSYMVRCEPIVLLSIGDLFVSPGPNSTIRMTTAQEYFHRSGDIHYIGTRTTRGVECDVWDGKYVDPSSQKNFTIEWYFAKRNVREGIGGTIEQAALFRYDIWEGTDTPVVHNVLQFDTGSPQPAVFDVEPCFRPRSKARLLLYFAVVGNGDISTVSASYLKNLLHVKLINKVMLPPLRISGVRAQYVGTTDLYVEAILLDKAPIINTNIHPSPPHQHALEAAYEFLKGAVTGGWNISVATTSSKVPIVIESRGILRLDYSNAFTTTTSSSTVTTPEATPALPIDTPTTMKPAVPTRERTPPLPPATTSSTTMYQQTQTPCTCPTVACPTVPSSNPVTQHQSTSTPSTPQSLISTVTCPTTTCRPCPRCTTPVSQTITPPTCPPITTPTPCPTSTTTVTHRKTSGSHSSTSAPTTSGVTLQQAQTQTQSSSGVDSGVTAGVAVLMFVVGLAAGVAILMAYRRWRQNSPDRRNILDKYLDNNDKY